MSEKKTETPAIPDGEELVSYTAPLLGSDVEQRPIIVGVNGETIRIKRGSTVQIKRKFLAVLENAQRQEYAAYLAMKAAEESSRKPLADM